MRFIQPLPLLSFLLGFIVLQLPQEDKKPGNGAPLVGILKNGNATPNTPTVATKNGDIATRIEEELEEEEEQQEPKESLVAPSNEQLLNISAVATPTDAAATNVASCKLLKKPRKIYIYDNKLMASFTAAANEAAEPTSTSASASTSTEAAAATAQLNGQPDAAAVDATTTLPVSRVHLNKLAPLVTISELNLHEL